MPICDKEHRYFDTFSNFPQDQGGQGRHICAGCAYELGFQSGENLEEEININLNNLPTSQAGSVRHKSPHAAFAKGYLDGVMSTYN